MAVYVDAIVQWPGARAPFDKGSCHLTADTLEELHAFALRIGMRRSWFQEHRICPHYDLTAGRREVAVRLGAVEETGMEGARRRRTARQRAALFTQEKPLICRACGNVCEEERRCYAHPTCYRCLPPPPALAVREVRR